MFLYNFYIPTLAY